MTGKIILTREQADAIEKIRAIVGNEGIVQRKAGSPWALEHNIFLNDMSLDDVVRLLYIGYEVEPEYKTGDWVVTDSFAIARVTRVEGKRIYAIWRKGEDEKWNISEFLRHATPEEIKAEEDRRKWAEIKKGDVVRSTKTERLAVFIQRHSTHREIGVQIQNGKYENWDEDSFEFYAKKVGASNA